MKMFRRIYFLGIFLLLASIVQPVHAQDLLPAYPQMSAYDHYAAYDKAGDVYLFDGETNTEKKISTHNSAGGFGGITVLSSGVYWGEWALGGDVYFYDFFTQQTSKLVSMATVGDMEKNNGLGMFRMLSYNFFEYSINKPGPNSTPRNQKYYNVTTHKAYGMTDFDTLGSGGNLEATHGDPYEIFRVNSAEKFNQGNGSVYAFEVAGMDDNNVLIYGYGNNGTPAGDIQYRIFNTVNGMTLKINGDSQKNIPYSNFIHPSSQFSYTNFVIGEGASATPSDDDLLVPYYRFDRKSPYTTANNLIKEVRNSKLAAHGADTLVWIEKNGTQTWYRANDNQTCTLGKNIPTAVDQRITTHSYFFWKDYGNNTALKAQKFLCVGDTAAQPAKTPVQQPTQETKPVPAQPVAVKTLLKSTGSPSIYYLGADGKRYVFYNGDIYSSWYRDFSGVKTVSPRELSAIPLGGNVTFRPGTLVKIQTEPHVYAVDHGGVLRGVVNEKIASSIFGAKWSSKIKIIPDFLFTNYRVGDDIRSSTDFNQVDVQAGSPDINADKGL